MVGQACKGVGALLKYITLFLSLKFCAVLGKMREREEKSIFLSENFLFHYCFCKNPLCRKWRTGHLLSISSYDWMEN